jgi:hypothetical protein
VHVANLILEHVHKVLNRPLLLQQVVTKPCTGKNINFNFGADVDPDADPVRVETFRKIRIRNEFEVKLVKFDNFSTKLFN